MRNDKGKALKMRLEGKSYSEITSALNIPKSTLSGWLSNIQISENLKIAINKRTRSKSLEGLLKRNRNQTRLARQRAQQIKTTAKNEISEISGEGLLLLGAALYWAEGYKRPKVVKGREVTHHPVSLTNSDPELVNMFLRFLRECCDVPEDKIKISIRMFAHQNESKLKEFWSRKTGIKYANFGKTYCGISKSSTGMRPFNRLEWGVVQLVVADTNLFHKIMGYIEKLKELANL
jgi:hypothetical protein